VVVQAARLDAVGFVVAGGRSERMGRDKALLPWGDGTLLGHAVARLSSVAADVRVLCGSEERYQGHGLPVVTDALSGHGAMSGLHAGLVAQGVGLGLYLAVDLPEVPADLLRALVNLAPGWDAVVPVTARGPEPLCAVYGPACLGAVKRCLAGGDVKMTAFWGDVRVREVGPDALAAFGDPERLFANLNSPDEYARRRPT
jgi:molybdopterin-guanine dinucleotide biosynthesis protein A